MVGDERGRRRRDVWNLRGRQDWCGRERLVRWGTPFNHFCIGLLDIEASIGGFFEFEKTSMSVVEGSFEIESEVRETISTSATAADKPDVSFSDGDFDVMVNIAASVKFSKAKRILLNSDTCSVAVQTVSNAEGLDRSANTLEFRTIYDIKNTIIPEINEIMSAVTTDQTERRQLRAARNGWVRALAEHRRRRASASHNAEFHKVGRELARAVRKAQFELVLPPFMNAQGQFQGEQALGSGESAMSALTSSSSASNDYFETEQYRKLSDALKRHGQNRVDCTTSSAASCRRILLGSTSGSVTRGRQRLGSSTLRTGIRTTPCCACTTGCACTFVTRRGVIKSTRRCRQRVPPFSSSRTPTRCRVRRRRRRQCRLSSLRTATRPRVPTSSRRLTTAS